MELLSLLFGSLLLGDILANLAVKIAIGIALLHIFAYLAKRCGKYWWLILPIFTVVMALYFNKMDDTMPPNADIAIFIKICAGVVISFYSMFLPNKVFPNLSGKAQWFVPIPGLIILALCFKPAIDIQNQRKIEQQKWQQEWDAKEAEREKERLIQAPGDAKFEEYCKNSGEKIYQTAQNVDSVLLLRVRGERERLDPSYSHRIDPAWEDAPMYSSEGYWPYTNEAYIARFFRYYSDDYDHSNNEERFIESYKYVDVLQPDNSIVRYNNISELIPNPTPGIKLNNTPHARYAVTYETIAKPEDRPYWLVGAVIKVIDTQNNQLMAEKTIYRYAARYGETKGRIDPWYHSQPCPQDTRNNKETIVFVRKVLHPATSIASTNHQ
jgi:hypothetical protein